MFQSSAHRMTEVRQQPAREECVRLPSARFTSCRYRVVISPIEGSTHFIECLLWKPRNGNEFLAQHNLTQLRVAIAFRQAVDRRRVQLLSRNGLNDEVVVLLRVHFLKTSQRFLVERMDFRVAKGIPAQIPKLVARVKKLRLAEVIPAETEANCILAEVANAIFGVCIRVGRGVFLRDYLQLTHEFLEGVCLARGHFLRRSLVRAQ